MLNKRIRTLAGLLCVILGAAILAVPVLSCGRCESAPVFSAMGHDDPVIIDPGHGGEDGGAVSPDGMYESDINLDVSLKLEKLMAFTGVRPVMTRSSRDIDYPGDADTIRKKKVYDQKTRVELINSLPGGVLISVHQNKYTDSGPSGAQVLFAATEGSGEFASVMESALAEAIGTENVRGAKQISPDIFLMKNVSCPAVLIECGFLSNPGDRAMLVTDGYQLKLACGIVCGYLRFIAEGT